MQTKQNSQTKSNRSIDSRIAFGRHRQYVLVLYSDQWQHLHKARPVYHPTWRAESWNGTSYPTCPFHSDSPLISPIPNYTVQSECSESLDQSTHQLAWMYQHYKLRKSRQVSGGNLQIYLVQRWNRYSVPKCRTQCCWRILPPTPTFVPLHNPIRFRHHDRLHQEMLWWVLRLQQTPRSFADNRQVVLSWRQLHYKQVSSRPSCTSAGRW